MEKADRGRAANSRPVAAARLEAELGFRNSVDRNQLAAVLVGLDSAEGLAPVGSHIAVDSVPVVDSVPAVDSRTNPVTGREN